MKKTKLLEHIFKLFFLFTNLLFLYKYGIRQNHVPISILITIYSLFCGFILYADVFTLPIIKKMNPKKVSVFTFLVIIVTLILLANIIDGNSLKVDKWSAMDVGIKALFNGEYPYTATDHLNGRTSNFPGLLLIGIPFYLLGNVAYLQVFAFALLCYTLYTYLEIKKAFYFILLLLISPAYWWEIFAMSDLLSNTIIVFCFVVFIKNYFKETIFKYPLLFGVSTCFLVLTRGIVWIPLILLVFRDFWFITTTSKLKYALSFIVTFLALVTLVLVNCPNFETLKNFNPLILQTSNLPTFVHIIAILTPFFISFIIVKQKNTFYKWSALLMLCPTLLAFILTLIKFGFSDLIVNSKYDLSYLTIVFPFLIFSFLQSNHTVLKNE